MLAGTTATVLGGGHTHRRSFGSTPGSSAQRFEAPPGPPVQAVVKWYNADKGFGFGLALVAPGSVIALAAYAGAGQVDWRLGIPLAVGGAVAISAGVAFAQSLPERRLCFAFCE
jgi:hypothetical protein